MRAFLVALLFCCTFSSFANNAYTLNIKPDGSQFTVTLLANPTTGFLWTVTKYDTSTFQLAKSQYMAPNTKLIGAGGKMVFTFVRRKGKLTPPSTLVVFTYARPWEKKIGTIKEINVQFQHTS